MNYSTSSGRKQANALISSRPSVLCGIDVVPPSLGSVIVTVYDSESNATANKTILAEIHVDSGMMQVSHEFLTPVLANRGIFVRLTETSATDTTYIVRYFLN